MPPLRVDVEMSTPPRLGVTERIFAQAVSEPPVPGEMKRSFLFEATSRPGVWQQSRLVNARLASEGSFRKTAIPRHFAFRTPP